MSATDRGADSSRALSMDPQESSTERFGESFVRDADLIPSRVAGQSWGGLHVDLDLPAGPYRVEGLTRSQVDQIEAKYRDRLGGGIEGVSPIEVSAFRVPADDFLPHPRGGEIYRMNFDYGSGRIRCVSHDFIGVIQLDAGGRPSRCAIFSSDEPGLLEGGSLENLLRVVMSYSALALGGLLLHSAAVLRGPRAFVFVGSSGAGKSTVSRLSAEIGLGVLSDDINLLLPDPDGGDSFAIEQVPFAGDFRDAPTVHGRHEVAAILALRHADRHRVEPISPARGSALLAAHAPFVNSDAQRSEALLATAASLVGRLPTNRLDFLPDAGFWDLL